MAPGFQECSQGLATIDIVFHDEHMERSNNSWVG
jgi:hypothetical protein